MSLEPSFIQVRVDNVSISSLGFVIFLKSVENEMAVLPIFVGAPEAQAITNVFNKLDAPRPLTHNLIARILTELDAHVSKARITHLEKNTFHAHLEVVSKDIKRNIDARPSDAIALALHVDAPIFVSKEIIEDDTMNSHILGPEIHILPKDSTPILNEESRKEDLRKQLDKAVKHERYEEAAQIRDELKTLEGAN